MTDIDIHAMLLRAEAKALKRLEEFQAVYGPQHSLCADLAEQYATACAVRRNWEDCERRASKENQSASSYKRVTGDPRILVRDIDELNALPAKDRFVGLVAVLLSGEQYELVTLNDWQEISGPNEAPTA